MEIPSRWPRLLSAIGIGALTLILFLIAAISTPWGLDLAGVSPNGVTGAALLVAQFLAGDATSTAFLLSLAFLTFMSYALGEALLASASKLVCSPLWDKRADRHSQIARSNSSYLVEYAVDQINRAELLAGFGLLSATFGAIFAVVSVVNGSLPATIVATVVGLSGFWSFRSYSRDFIESLDEVLGKLHPSET
ncbi:hypothetical protein [Rubellimicrobium aerolatum]|uniref:Uncharacterized protein n=1 Tax=Rubellimicrobium aerolatum TaxID=490979 RepID=A0ABW0SB23_9RHOB|nr:hypothetical protein [Rubellimicrobium aerolatum]MBP1805344.1 hypothetical protein [Rubellimicrobium aerolatum]